MFDSDVDQPSPPSDTRPEGWPKGRERSLLLGAVAFQLVVLVGMIAIKAAPLVTGDVVLLRVVPVDPRDMFRGQYVTLSYEFSRTPPGGIVGLSGADFRVSQGQTVYAWVVPEADGLHWRAEQLSTQPPPAGKKYLRGTIGQWGRPEFGIESFYVQEGNGLQYEQAVRQRRLSAEVAVAPNGQATLRSLKIEP